MRSILTNEESVCYLCEGRAECVHHIYYGTKQRSVSDKMGFVVPLCNRCHNMSDNSVHFNHRKDMFLKQKCQRKFEETHSREEFMRLIGRNYLEEG